MDIANPDSPALRYAVSLAETMGSTLIGLAADQPNIAYAGIDGGATAIDLYGLERSEIELQLARAEEAFQSLVPKQVKRQWRALIADRTTALRDANLQLEQVNRQLEQASTTDALTGLHNRRYLTQCIAADVAAVHRRREEGEMDAGICFFMVDLDHFKSVNDTYGHAAGDAVLREVARRLEAVARQSDRLIRWGGEEFLLVARDTSLSEAEALADRLCEAMRAAPFELLPGVRVARTCSVGFAALPLFGARPQAADWSDVVDMADRALYLAKAGGRDGWVGLAAGPALAPEVAAVRAAAEDVELAQADGRLVGRSGFGPGGPRLDPAGRAADASLQLAKHFSPETVPFTIGMNNF